MVQIDELHEKIGGKKLVTLYYYIKYNLKKTNLCYVIKIMKRCTYYSPPHFVTVRLSCPPSKVTHYAMVVLILLYN